MATVLVQSAPRPDLAPGDFADITPATVTIEPHPNGSDAVLTFDADLTGDQIAAVAERARMPSAERTLRDRARNALTSNQAWVDNVYPQLVAGADAILNDASASTQEKNLAQGVKSLANQLRDVTQQNNVLIRLVVRAFT